MTQKFNFETSDGEILSVECSIICRDRDGADAEFDDVSLMRTDGTFIEETSLSEADQSRLERKLQSVADDAACDAYTDYLMDAADAYHDRMKEGED